MAKGRRTARNGRSKGTSRFVKLEFWLLKSRAYRSISVGARALLVELYSLYNSYNNGDLFLSVRDAAERLNVAPNTARRLFAELCDRGFIRVAELGSFNCKRKIATTWILTEFEHRNQLPTKDFMHWPAEKQNTDAIRAPSVSRAATEGMAQTA